MIDSHSIVPAFPSSHVCLVYDQYAAIDMDASTPEFNAGRTELGGGSHAARGVLLQGQLRHGRHKAHEPGQRWKPFRTRKQRQLSPYYTMSGFFKKLEEAGAALRDKATSALDDGRQSHSQHAFLGRPPPLRPYWTANFSASTPVSQVRLAFTFARKRL